MSDKKLNGEGGLKWESIWKWGKWFVTCVIAVAGVVCSGAYFAGQIIQEFRSHTVAAEAWNEEQDDKLDVHDSMFANHETRIDGVELNVAMLGPAAAERQVENAISLVQDEIDCHIDTGNESGWVSVPAASSKYLSDELRVRVEEHFRRLGYEVNRERQLPTGRLRCFWIFVKQSNEA